MLLLEARGYQPLSGAPVIFLAGPCPGAPPWQPEAFDLITRLDDTMIVVSPRRFHSVEHYRYKPTEGLSSFHRQRAWERHYMDVAARRGCVLFWLPGPAVPLDGIVYGATTRYEIGLWSSRFSRDRSIGLCVGTDGEFPTVHTIAYDLEHEMAGEPLHQSLAETVRAAARIARDRYEAWRKAGCPDVEYELALETITHEELADGFEYRRLDGNPMNDTEALRRATLAILDIAPDYSALEPVSVEEAPDSVEAGEGLVDLDYEELADEIPEPSEAERSRLRAQMRTSGDWYLLGRRVDGPKYLAIGRSTYYLAFLQRLAVELGTPVYQSDFMEWIEPTHPETSLAYYLDSAERIDVNLEGVSVEHLIEATTGAKRRVPERFALPSGYMTSWEINQLYYARLSIPVFWHTGGSMTHDEAYGVLKDRFAKEWIIED